MNRQPPIQPPSGQPPKPSPNYVDPTAVGKIRAPAITLIITASIWIVLLAISISFTFGELSTFEVAEMTEEEKETAQALAFSVVAIVCNLIIIVGSVCMLLRKAYTLAFLSLIVAIIPGFGPCLLIGTALGVWALVEFRKPGVKEGFG